MLKSVALAALIAPAAIGAIRKAVKSRKRPQSGRETQHVVKRSRTVELGQRLKSGTQKLRCEIGSMFTANPAVAVGILLATRWTCSAGVLEGKLPPDQVDSNRAIRPRARSAEIFGLRGIAAISLLTVHVGMFSGLLGTKVFGVERPPSNALGAFFVGGLPAFIGVFFVLPAAYLFLPAARSIVAGEDLPPMYRPLVKRLARLLPAYYVLCLVALFLLNDAKPGGIWYFLRPFLLAQIYFPSPFTPQFINGLEITWTVPSMVQWYVMLTVLAMGLHSFASRGATPHERAKRLLVPVPALISVGIGWLLLVKARGWDNRMVFWWPQGFAPTIAMGIFLSVQLAMAEMSPQEASTWLKTAARRPWLMWLAAAGVYLLNCARPFSVIGMDAIYTTSGLLVTYACVALFGLLSCSPLIAPNAKRTLVHTVLGSAPLAYLGKVSYGVYLWHFAVMHAVLQRRALRANAVRPLRELYGTMSFPKLESSTIIGAVGLATISYRVVEKPVEDWISSRLRT